MIRENNIPGITDPEFLVNWVDVRDVGKWVGTCFEFPEVFSNESLSIASSPHGPRAGGAGRAAQPPRHAVQRTSSSRAG
jgi:hypothetical protein